MFICIHRVYIHKYMYICIYSGPLNNMRVRGAHRVENPPITWPCTSLVLHSRIQPTMDHVVLQQYLLRGKDPTYKWTHAVQTCIVQRSTLYLLSWIIMRINVIMYQHLEQRPTQRKLNGCWPLLLLSLVLQRRCKEVVNHSCQVSQPVVRWQDSPRSSRVPSHHHNNPSGKGALLSIASAKLPE